MKCNDNELLLMDYLEGNLDAQTARVVELHLEECPRCQARFEAMSELVGGLIEIPEIGCSNAFDSGLLSALELVGDEDLLSCEQVEELICLEGLDDLPSEVSRLAEAHLASCASCSANAQDARQLEHALALVEEIAPTSNAKAALHAYWAEEDAPTVVQRVASTFKPRARLSYGTVAAAAVLLVAFALPGLMRGTGTAPTAGPDLQVTTTAPETTPGASVTIASAEPASVAASEETAYVAEGAPTSEEAVALLPGKARTKPTTLVTMKTQPRMSAAGADNGPALNRTPVRATSEERSASEAGLKPSAGIQIAYAPSIGSGSDALARSVRLQRASYENNLKLLVSQDDKGTKPVHTDTSASGASSVTVASNTDTGASSGEPAKPAEPKPARTTEPYGGSLPANSIPF